MLDGTGPENKAAPSAWQAGLIGLARCVRFFSRLPVPGLPFEADPHAAPDLSGMVRALPFAGLVIGLPASLVLAASLALGLDSWLCATLSIAALAVSTGAMHEDGLADLADSFGGATRERKLAIMKDSLVGSYGVCALILAFLLRIGALAALADRLDALPVCLGFLAACSLSRLAGVAPLAFLPPARSDGLSRGVGQPSRDSFWIGAILATCVTILLGFFGGLPKAGIGLMLIAAALAGWLVTRLSRRLFGGQTGDVAGAGQQAAEIAVWLALLIAVTP
ncbi:adenosylcobinamide-GDP ribazoletransferase [Microvirga pudoricolor]|uniref:adenosylcobinamide-GDP ribazoletransferase n=1 Tax=Microvirga pudoricolor TaxID=2778729 RepID=UPI00194FAE0F|nr:adenosylcobinamide-GDP ribazoletransferase [Microvirga pudoricolor]MBM6594647.1 adenosylcobinamide-GDP ribazoletransferase [Microvirga pudoricolor]